MTHLCHSPSEKPDYHSESRSAETSLLRRAWIHSTIWSCFRNSRSPFHALAARGRCSARCNHVTHGRGELTERHHFIRTLCSLLDVNNRSEVIFWPVGRLNSAVKLEGGGGAQICTQQDGFYVTHMRCDEMVMKMMMAQGEKDPKHTSRVVLVKRIIMKHDNPVRIA